jgi:hypothetical protein
VGDILIWDGVGKDLQQEDSFKNSVVINKMILRLTYPPLPAMSIRFEGIHSTGTCQDGLLFQRNSPSVEEVRLVPGRRDVPSNAKSCTDLANQWPKTSIQRSHDYPDQMDRRARRHEGIIRHRAERYSLMARRE